MLNFRHLLEGHDIAEGILRGPVAARLWVVRPPWHDCGRHVYRGAQFDEERPGQATSRCIRLKRARTGTLARRHTLPWISRLVHTMGRYTGQRIGCDAARSAAGTGKKDGAGRCGLPGRRETQGASGASGAVAHRDAAGQDQTAQARLGQGTNAIRARQGQFACQRWSIRPSHQAAVRLYGRCVIEAWSRTPRS